jgi:hypothetical protein
MQEVYVEGPTDRSIIGEVLDLAGLSHVAVLTIDVIEVPTANVLSLGLFYGNRGRVITLSALLEGRVTPDKAVCLADSDTDFVRAIRYQYSLLLFTDATSLESYALDQKVIRRFSERSARNFPKSPEEIVEDLANLLKEPFLLRAACEEIGCSASFGHDITESMRFDKSKLEATLRMDHYRTRAFQGPTQTDPGGNLDRVIAKLRTSLPVDIRQCVHGHDLEILFGWYIRSHPRFGHLDATTLSLMLIQLIEAEHLAKQPLGVELIARLT